MIVKDLEKDELEKEQKKKDRKEKGYGVDEDTDSDDEGKIVKGKNSKQLKSTLNEKMLASRRQTSSGIQKPKSKAQIYNNYKKYRNKFFADLV